MQETFIGRTRDRERVTVEFELESLTKPVETTEHETVYVGRRFSATGAVYAPGDREPHAAGQCLDVLLNVCDPAPGIAVADIFSLHAIWQRWHLNDMRPACAHMPRAEWLKRDANGQVSCTENVCWAGTGYRYGTSWLYEPIPSHVVTEIQRLTQLVTQVRAA